MASFVAKKRESRLPVTSGRTTTRLSLADVQQATGIDRSALCRIESGENGNPTVNTLIRYVRAVGRRINVALVDADPIKA